MRKKRLQQRSVMVPPGQCTMPHVKSGDHQDGWCQLKLCNPPYSPDLAHSDLFLLCYHARKAASGNQIPVKRQAERGSGKLLSGLDWFHHVGQCTETCWDGKVGVGHFVAYIYMYVYYIMKRHFDNVSFNASPDLASLLIEHNLHLHFFDGWLLNGLLSCEVIKPLCHLKSTQNGFRIIYYLTMNNSTNPEC